MVNFFHSIISCNVSILGFSVNPFPCLSETFSAPPSNWATEGDTTMEF